MTGPQPLKQLFIPIRLTMRSINLRLNITLNSTKNWLLKSLSPKILGKSVLSGSRKYETGFLDTGFHT